MAPAPPPGLKIIAAILDLPLRRLPDAEHGVALGATRLARMALTGESPTAICIAPAPIEIITPDPALTAAYADRLPAYRKAAEVTSVIANMN